MKLLFQNGIVALITGAALGVTASQPNPDVAPKISKSPAAARRTPAPPEVPHPMALEPLLPWISDRVSPVVVVRRNTPAGLPPAERYTTEEGRVGRCASRSEDQGGWFRLLPVGTLPSGLQVFESGDNGGGSGVFQALILVKPTTARYGEIVWREGLAPAALTAPEVSAYEAVLDHPMGDRSETVYTLSGERVRYRGHGSTPEEANEIFSGECDPTPRHPPAVVTPLEPDRRVQSVNLDFTLDGREISPGLLREFLHPSVLAIDLLRPGRNRNDVEFVMKHDAAGATRVEATTGDGDFAYSVLGRLPDGPTALSVEKTDTAGKSLLREIWLVRCELAARPEFIEAAGTGRISRAENRISPLLRLLARVKLPVKATPAVSLDVPGRRLRLITPSGRAELLSIPTKL